jgi:hypothetical protein
MVSFNPVDLSTFLNLLDYYSSFFNSALRAKSLLFFLGHLRAFSYSKKIIVVLKELLFSFIGLPILGGSQVGSNKILR